MRNFWSHYGNHINFRKTKKNSLRLSTLPVCVHVRVYVQAFYTMLQNSSSSSICPWLLIAQGSGLHPPLHVPMLSTPVLEWPQFCVLSPDLFLNLRPTLVEWISRVFNRTFPPKCLWSYSPWKSTVKILTDFIHPQHAHTHTYVNAHGRGWGTK